MGRQKSSKSSRQYALLCLAPVFVVVVAPLYLHVAVKDSTELIDADVMTFLVFFLAMSTLSVLGCALDGICLCPKSFPLFMLITSSQMMLSIGGIIYVVLMLRYPVLPAGAAPHTSVTGGSEQAALRLPPRQVEHVMPVAGVQRHPFQLGDVSAGKSARLPQALPKKVETPLMENSLGLYGWTDVGDGYCWDSDSHEEFSSLHANGKTLPECKEVAAADKYSIAIDFSAGDGGCDIRYPAGAIAQDVAGYAWWEWGTGTGKPTGSGKQKHDRETRCYARVLGPAVDAMSATHSKSASPAATILSSRPHKYLKSLAREYSFRNVQNEHGQIVNIVLVRAPWQSRHEEELFDKYKHELLFIGISSLEDYPLPPPNPFSRKWPRDKYVGLFPGFLNMYRDPEKIYPSHVKTLLMSQSDFSIPGVERPVPKRYDFTFSGSDQDIANGCVGWSMFCKNWSFVMEALEVMCGELDMRGVLVATKDKQGIKACTIPASCEGKMEQTTFLTQDGFFSYVKQSRFLFVPQVHDASPRVVAQALALNVPLLMNKNIIGGWKYLNEKTGEFFNDLSDFRQSVKRLLKNVEAGNVYEPRKYVDENYGDAISGARFFKFIDENFRHRVKLPEGTTKLFPIGA